MKTKPRFLCLHGMRTSAKIFKEQIFKRWPDSILENIDLVFIDAPFPSLDDKPTIRGFVGIDDLFDPPYYDWFQFDQEFMEYKNLDECIDYIQDCMLKLGHFDGLMGFSQGGIFSATLPALQKKGLALNKVPQIRNVMIIGGATFLCPVMAEKAHPPGNKNSCKSLHFLGETDILKERGMKLLESFVNPYVIHHPRGHTIPRLGKPTELLM
ncbi:esterase OVCA2-like [Papaver somniferum]|uniref:esterase OVCA2-like n=1 Tax=Papaver somniferum TaxID=3469 RepID=UPI000E6F598C|nr:esterase OVCA2-like [Papaver somniferum]